MCLIKPDAYSYRDEIVGTIEKLGITVIRRIPLLLTESFIKELYYDVHPLILEATLHHLLSGTSEILLIEEHENTISKVLSAVGLETNPAHCDSTTLRFRYGNHTPQEIGEGLNYYYNAVHRPKNQDEAQNDMRILSSFIRY